MAKKAEEKEGLSYEESTLDSRTLFSVLRNVNVKSEDVLIRKEVSDGSVIVVTKRGGKYRVFPDKRLEIIRLDVPRSQVKIK